MLADLSTTWVAWAQSAPCAGGPCGAGVRARRSGHGVHAAVRVCRVFADVLLLLCQLSTSALECSGTLVGLSVQTLTHFVPLSWGRPCLWFLLGPFIQCEIIRIEPG